MFKQLVKKWLGLTELEEEIDTSNHFYDDYVRPINLRREKWI